jgi:hypothetical protein
MDKYNFKSKSNSFVYTYNMPTAIVVKEPVKPKNTKRRFMPPFKRKLKSKAPVSKTTNNAVVYSVNTHPDFIRNPVKIKKGGESSSKCFPLSRLTPRRLLRSENDELGCCKIS